MKNILALFVALMLTACSGSSSLLATPTLEPTQTPQQNIASAAENLILQNMQYQMTRDAASAKQESAAAQLTATAMVLADRATQQAEAKSASATQKAEIKSDNATAQARSDSATQQAVIAGQTQQAWSVTVTAAVVATQTAFPMTQTAMPMYATAEAASLRARGTQEAGNAELTNLTVQRQTMKNGLDAYLPWTLIVSSFAIGALAIIVFAQYRQLKRDRNGLIGIEAVKHKNGVTYVKPDQMTGAALTVNKQGQITEAGSDSDFQQQTTRRQQLVEVLKGKTVPEVKQMIGMFGAPGGSSGSVNYFDADRMFGKILGEAEEEMVDGEVTDV